MNTELIHKKNELGVKTIEQLREAFVELHHNAICKVYDTSISIDVLYPEGVVRFESMVSIYTPNKAIGSIGNKINFQSVGSFEPKDEVELWRTIHAYSMLKNWDSVCCIANQICQELQEFTFNQKQKQKQLYENNKSENHHLAYTGVSGFTLREVHSNPKIQSNNL